MYLGAKSVSGACQAIVAQMPPHDTFIETHFGTGAVMRAKPPAERNIAVEIDAETLATYPPPAGAEVVNGCALTFLRSFDYTASGRVLIYTDPPYLPVTRSSHHRYRFDYTEDDHRELLAVLRSVPAMVILSGYPSRLYEDQLSGWRKLTFQAMTRGGPRTECLWMNFEAGDVQWATFAGTGFADRQRIRRKAARWAAKYRELPQAEQLAVLAALLAEDEQALQHRQICLSRPT